MELCNTLSFSSSPSFTFSAIHQPKTITAVKHVSHLAFPNRLQFSIFSAVLATPSPFLSFKHTFGGAPKTNIITHLTASQDWIDELLVDEDDDDYEESDEMEGELEPQVGDGECGGGASLGGTVWGSKALAIAEEVIFPFKDDLEIFAFKASNKGQVFVRLDKLSDKYGTPSVDDLETFSSIYSERLDEAKQAGALPASLTLEVSSPGAERVVRVPKDLERFKDLPMYVRYTKGTTVSENGSQEHNIYLAENAIPDDGSQEHDGIFQLDNVEMELGYCTWKLANVRLNRELLGKGRPLNKKKREWRLQLPFTSLLHVRLYLDI